MLCGIRGLSVIGRGPVNASVFLIDAALFYVSISMIRISEVILIFLNKITI